MKWYFTTVIIVFSFMLYNCESEDIFIPNEKSEMDKLCECFEDNNAYSIAVNAELDSVKRDMIVIDYEDRLENCRKLAVTIREALNEMEEKDRRENQESFENSCSAYKEFIDNNY